MNKPNAFAKKTPPPSEVGGETEVMEAPIPTSAPKAKVVVEDTREISLVPNGKLTPLTPGKKVIVKVTNFKRSGLISVGSILTPMPHFKIPVVDLGLDNTGQPKYFYLDQPQKELDLGNEQDCLFFDALRNNLPCYVAPYTSGKLYELIDPEKIDSEIIRKGNAKAKAYGIINGMSPVDQRKFYRMYVDNVNHLSDSSVEAKLFDEIERNANVFMDKINDPQREVKEVLLDAKENAQRLGLQLKTKLGRWEYQNQHIGNTIDDAVNYFYENQDDMRFIRTKVFGK